jgi:ArsR family transcriptional regulator
VLHSWFGRLDPCNACHGKQDVPVVRTGKGPDTKNADFSRCRHLAGSKAGIRSISFTLLISGKSSKLLYNDLWILNHVLTGTLGEVSVVTKEAADNPQPQEENSQGWSLLGSDRDIERASRSLKAMSHPLRLKILCTLGENEVSVHEIVNQVGSSQSNISQHLAILRDKGILDARKEANRVFYRVADSRTLQLIGMMRQVFCSHSQ